MVRRRGMSLLEISTAGILLATMLVVCVQFFRATAAQRRGLQARRLAIQEAANVMERLSARPWQELTPEGVGEVQLSAESQQMLTQSKLEIEVTEPDELGGKRITVVLRWLGRSERSDRSVRLVAWRYRESGD